METKQVQENYANVNGLKMYYEIHGTGRPLVLLHGGLSTSDTIFGKMLPTWAKTRQVIAVEQQGHGHTADIDRPLSYEQMAEDTAALLRQLGIEQADFFGFSDGGNVALQIAIQHPDLVRKLVAAANNYNNDGLCPEHTVEMFRLLGGGVAGDIAGLPNAWLAVLPGTTHFTFMERADWLLSMITEFLDAPKPEGQ